MLNNRRVYIYTALHPTSSSCVLHKASACIWSLYTRRRLHRKSFTHRSFYTEQFLHREIFTQRSLDTEKLWCRVAFTQRSLYTVVLIDVGGSAQVKQMRWRLLFVDVQLIRPQSATCIEPKSHGHTGHWHWQGTKVELGLQFHQWLSKHSHPVGPTCAGSIAMVILNAPSEPPSEQCEINSSIIPLYIGISRYWIIN